MRGFGMRPKEYAKTPQSDLFRLKLVNLIDLRHELCRLGEKIHWSELIDEFGALYSENGRPGIPIRLMAGLHYLKHALGLSDEVVVKSWVENPYWQYFCGEEYFQHRLPIDPSQMTRFRTRVGASGCEKLLQLTIAAGLQAGAVKPSSFTQVTVDTTVQEKAVAFPTDGRSYHKGRVWLVRLAKRSGIELRQSYLRVGKQALFMQQRYSAARQVRRARRELKRSKVYLGRVYRDILRELPRQSATVRELFTEPLARIARLLAQQRHDHHKLYSLHAPEVECIAKVRREVAYIIVSADHRVGDETGRSVGRSLPVHASLVTMMCEAMGTTGQVFGPRRLPRGSVVTCEHQRGWGSRLGGMINKSELLKTSLCMTSQRC